MRIRVWVPFADGTFGHTNKRLVIILHLFWCSILSIVNHNKKNFFIINWILNGVQMARALSDTGWHRRYINIPPRKKIGKKEEKKRHTQKKRNAYTNSCSFEEIRENKWPTKNENTLTPAILISCATYTPNDRRKMLIQLCMSCPN